MKLPKYIDIELNTSCNLSCDFCPYEETHKNPEFMSIGLYEKIINQLDWNPSIKLCQRGEPLLSPILFDAIEKASEKGLSTIFNTNGLMLDNDIIFANLIRSSIERLILSDYGIEKQWKNVKQFVETCKVYDLPIKIIVKTTNKEKWIDIADEIIEPIFHDYSDRENEDDTILDDWKCEQLFERLIIEPDGSVRCCCGSVHIDKYVGKIFFNSLKDIWNSEKLKHSRNLHLEGRSHELEMCRKCGYRKSVIKEREK